MRAGIQPLCFAQRIENGVGEGVPDVWICSRENGRGAWVELKHRSNFPVRVNTPIFAGSSGLRPDQVAWIHGRAQAGAAIFILGQCDDRMWLVHGKYIRELHAWSRAQLDAACAWSGKARGTDWAGLVAVLFG